MIRTELRPLVVARRQANTRGLLALDTAHILADDRGHSHCLHVYLEVVHEQILQFRQISALTGTELNQHLVLLKERVCDDARPTRDHH